MNIEQRVQALEEEVQILKNQIQATLLDIQESLLTNTYPSLRAVQIAAPVEMREPEPSRVVPQPQPQVQPQPQMQPAQSQPHHKVVSMRDIETQPDIEEPIYEVQQPREVYEPTPQQRVKQVEPVHAPRMQSMMNEETQSAPPTRRRRKNNDSDELYASDWAALTKLEDWTRQRVEEIGAPSTRTLIEQYARKRKLAPEVADALIQFIAAFESTTWEGESPSRPDAPSSFLQHFIHEAAAAEVDPLMFLNENNDFANNGSMPFVFDPTVWGDGASSSLKNSDAPIRVVNGDGVGNERKSRKQLIGRLIEGLKKVEGEV